MNEWSYRSRIVLCCLVALFMSVLFGALAFAFVRRYSDPQVALTVAASITISLIASILAIAFFFRPRTLLSGTTRVFLYGIGAVSSGFSLIAANQLWDLFLSIAATTCAQFYPSIILPLPNDNKSVFLLLCVTVFAICVLALVLERPQLGCGISVAAPLQQDELPARSRYSLWLWADCLVFPASILVAMLLLKHKLHSDSPYDDGQYSSTSYPIQVLRTMLSATAVYYTLVAVTIWCKRSRALREEYSLYASAAVALLVGVIVSTFIALDNRLRTPWAVALYLLETIANGAPTWLTEDWAHITVATACTVAMCLVLWLGFLNWSGQKSIDQHRQEQRHEDPQLFIEGLTTWCRALTGASLPMPYNPPLASYDSRPQGNVFDRFDAWKDRARELVWLTTTSYALGEETAWHDHKQCWVGRNVDTGKRVVLFISRSDDLSQLDEQLAYITELAHIGGSDIGDIIVATEAPIASPPHTLVQGVRIQWRSENELLDNLVDFRDYYSAIRRRVTVDTLPDSDLTVEQVYSESEIQRPRGAGVTNLETYLNLWSVEPGGRQLAILGEYGQGKSTAALMWAYKRIQASDPRTRIPILIELRGLSPRNLGPEELLAAWGQRYNINPRALLRLVIAGRLVLIFEGFDEMDLVGDAEMRQRHFRALWRFAFEKSKLVFTGRPNLFFTTPELEQALRTGTRTATGSNCEPIVLKFFGIKQIAEALRGHSVDIRNQILERANNDARFKEMVSRPSLLHVVASLWLDHKLLEKDPALLTSAYVMDLFIRASYRRQEMKSGVSGTFNIGLTIDELAYFMSGIATYMAANGLENQITASRLRDAFDELYLAIPESVSLQPSLGAEPAEPLKRRIGLDEFKREGILAAVHTAGLLVNDPAAIDRFSFAHKSFMEFLVADVVSERILRPQSEREAAICNATSATVLTVFNLPVAVQFLSELVVSRIQASPQDNERLRDRNWLLAVQLFNQMVANRYNPLQRVVVMAIALTCGAACEGMIRDYNRSRSSVERYVALLTRYQIIICIVVFFAALSTLSGIVYKSDIIQFIGSAVLGMCTAASVAIVVPRPRGHIMRLRSWKAVCSRIPIPSEVMHRIVCTKWVPGLGGAPLWLLTPHEVQVIRIQVDAIAERRSGITKQDIRHILEVADEWYCADPASDSRKFNYWGALTETSDSRKFNYWGALTETVELSTERSRSADKV